MSISLVQLGESHRTRPEQLVGLGIYLLLSFGAYFLSGLAVQIQNRVPDALYFASVAAAMWVLWRSFSLKTLKLELSLFLAQLLFQMGWGVSFFILGKALLSLVILLFLWCMTLGATFLFWKKKRLAGALLFFPVSWVLYMAALNMMLCLLAH